ncbi:MAG: hypothetical protein ACREP9_15855, partial [Candidatus Dormibacteraceae bacterium]
MNFRFSSSPKRPAPPCDNESLAATGKALDDGPPPPPEWGYRLLQPEAADPTAQPSPRASGAGTSVRIGLFGARKRLRRVEEARAEVVAQNAALANEVTQLQRRVAELRGKDALSLETELS